MGLGAGVLVMNNMMRFFVNSVSIILALVFTAIFIDACAKLVRSGWGRDSWVTVLEISVAVGFGIFLRHGILTYIEMQDNRQK